MLADLISFLIGFLVKDCKFGKIGVCVCKCGIFFWVNVAAL